LIARVLSYK